MIKRLIGLIVVIMISVCALASCDLSGLLAGNNTPPDKDNNGLDKDPEGIIYNAESDVYIVVGEGATGDDANKLSLAITEARGFTPFIIDDSTEKQSHEIILGQTNRELSATALMYLERNMDNYSTGDEGSYLIYSDTNSVAVVFDEDYDNVSKKFALDHIIDNYVGETMTVSNGIVKESVFDLVEDYYKPLDQEYRSELIAEAREKLGDSATDALVSLMSLYNGDTKLMEWFAGLYDPCICVCKGLGEEVCQDTVYCRAQGGGFYYSNSARDNVGYLPDVETTRQALDFLNLSGMTWMYGNSYTSGALPNEMLKDIGRYVQALQCEDGYFRHPQWENVEDYDMRLNRDLNWATTILNNAGLPFVYKTPTNLDGAGRPSWMDQSLTSRLGVSSVNAVSKVVATAGHPAMLDSVETLRAELESRTEALKTNSYGTGSWLSTYGSQITARDAELYAEKLNEDPDYQGSSTPLADLIIEWLNTNMNDRGTWVIDPNEEGKFAETNGVMKIVGLYSVGKADWPRGLEAMEACVEVLKNDQKAKGSVDIYNAWIALNGVYNSIIKYSDDTQKKLDAEKFMSDFYQNDAAEAINNSRKKLSTFRRLDGSYSYTVAFDEDGNELVGQNSSMGMKTAVPGSKEGDVNGCLIATVDSWGNICSALGIKRIPIYGAAEMYKFRKIIDDSQPVIKQGAGMDYMTVDFEEEELGDKPNVGITFGGRSEGFSATVEKDDEKENNYLKFVTTGTFKAPNTTAGDSIYVTCDSQSAAARSYVFEGDFCVTSANGENAYQVFVGNCTILFIRVSGGKVKLVEGSSDSAANSLNMDLGVSLDLGDWFRLKIVYYLGDHDTVRIKIYFDDLSDGEDELQLLAVTDNYYDKNGDKFEAGGGKPSDSFKHAHIYSYSPLEGTLLLDNLAAYRSKDEYVRESDINNQPKIYNIDPPDSEEKLYEFSSDELHSDITVEEGDGNVSVGSGVLNFAGASKISVPINVRTAGSKCATASFKLNVDEQTAVGTDVLTLTFTENLGDIISLVFRVAQDSQGKFITCVEKNEAEGAALTGVRIPLGEAKSVSVDFHHDYDVALVFADGSFVGASNKIYKGAERRTATALEISSAGGCSIDDLVFEKNKNSYDEATKPNHGSVYYDFESDNNDVVLSDTGAEIANKNYFGSISKAVVLTQTSALKPSSLTLPVNERANLYSLFIFEASLRFENSNTNGQTHIISAKDASGKAVYSIALKVNGDLVELYEVGQNGNASARMASVSKSETFKLTVEVYPDNRMAHIYVNGVCVAKSSIFKDHEGMTYTPESFEIATSSTRSTLCIDNVKAETLYELYESVEVKPEKNTDTSNPLNFDKSNTGSLPDKIISNGVNFRVENELNTVTGEYSNVGVLDTVRGRNESVGVKLDKENTNSAVIFETDVKFSNNEYDHLAQIFFGENNSKHIYGLLFSVSGDGFKITNYCDTNRTTLVDGLSLDTWYRIKVEYFVNDDGSSRTRLYIDGTLKYVTDQYIGMTEAPKKNVSQVMFYTFLDGKCSIYVDNMSLTTSSDTCFDEVGKK